MDPRWRFPFWPLFSIAIFNMSDVLMIMPLELKGMDLGSCVSMKNAPVELLPRQDLGRGTSPVLGKFGDFFGDVLRVTGVMSTEEAL